MNRADVIHECYMNLFTALEHAARCEWTYFAYYYGQCVQGKRLLDVQYCYDITSEKEFLHRYNLASQTFMNRCHL